MATDIAGATIEIGTNDNGLDLLIIDGPDGRTIDLLPVGAADARDEGMVIRLDRDLAARLAAELSGRLTG